MQYAQNQHLDRLPMADIIQNIAPQFLGAKYQAGLIDRSATEKLFISLKEFDCVLFLKTVLALSHNFALKNYHYSAFSQQVFNQRYRHGILDGYCSRLHYFSDWINDNQKRGNVENIIQKLGGITLDKKLSFMSKNRPLYPQLKPQSNYDCIQQVERQLESLSLTYIPTAKIKDIYPQLQAGDIIGVVTNIAGLDTTHTGLVYRFPDGKISLIHASPAGQVTIAKDLQKYISKVDKAIGIFLVRPLDPRNN
ncbi:DUF1460 domain-containing protein [Microcystis aeruginosa CS-338/01]|uniref:N-acetylmuramoyl-L-alanine amidase-like domain-containing protein n=1 Tax=Microcystis aeruginosa TaxID=1126 RepID=UPI00232B6F14|nr:N-acetylmuramoyl-L-alanine amidase-like domain-containing protein [Microcystis aeruginosa]MDB9506273.1 DUF1460 domain-containing protein [Microcystis aeruginosa CS-338/01]